MIDDTVSRACGVRVDKLIEQLKEQRCGMTPEQRAELNERLIRGYQQKLKDLLFENAELSFRAFVEDEINKEARRNES